MPKDKNLDIQTKRAFQTGGYNLPAVPQPYGQPGPVNPQTGTYALPGTGIAGYQIPSGGPTGYTPYGGAAPYFQPVQFTGPQFQTSLQTTNLPTFAETVGSKVGQYDELRTYVNDAGQILRIPFKNGQPIYPIPAGYRPQGNQPVAEQPITTIPISETVMDQSDGGGDGPDNAGIGAGTSVSGYPGRTGLSGLQSAFSNFGSYDTTTPPSENPYGVTGQRGINIGSLASLATGIPGLGSLVDSEMGLFGYGPSAGFPGGNVDTSMSGGVRGMSRSDLEGIMSGAFSPSDYDDMGFGVTASQARSAVEAANVLGLETITGVYGYKKGDAIAGVQDGFIDSKGVGRNVATGALNGHYEDIESFIGRLSMTRAEKEAADLDAGQAAVSNAMARQQDAQAARTAARRGKGIGQLGDTTPGDTPSDNTPSSPSTGKGVASGDYGKGMGPHGGAPSAPSAPSAPDAPSVGVEETGPDTGMGDAGPSDGGGYGSDGGVGGGMGVICLTEDMKVKRNGVIDFVTEVQVGDTIDNTVVTEVLHKHMREGYYKVNGELKITNDHPVLANGSWKRTEDLVLGDYINNVKVTSLEYVEQVTPTVYIGTAEDRYDVYTEGEVYTVHGQYKNALKKAA